MLGLVAGWRGCLVHGNYKDGFHAEPAIAIINASVAACLSPNPKPLLHHLQCTHLAQPLQGVFSSVLRARDLSRRDHDTGAIPEVAIKVRHACLHLVLVLACFACCGAVRLGWIV